MVSFVTPAAHHGQFLCIARVSGMLAQRPSAGAVLGADGLFAAVRTCTESRNPSYALLRHDDIATPLRRSIMTHC